jgi:DNA-binding MarR family transcriptional regulator
MSRPSRTETVDPAKYYRGSYALCPQCGARPCVPSCPTQAPQPGAEAASRGTTKAVLVAMPTVDSETGTHAPQNRDQRAFPWIVSDKLVRQLGITGNRFHLLYYLHRETYGRGQPNGAYLSNKHIAEGTLISETTVKELLNWLERNRLIERNRGFERSSRERATTHILVTIPEA